jgi:hypothetical protein
MDLHTIIANLHMVQQILQARQGLEDRDVQGMLLQRVRGCWSTSMPGGGC